MMMHWDDLRALDMTTVRVNLGRTADVLAAYSAHKAALALAGKTLERYVMTEVVGDAPYVLARNAFRYNIAPDIEHLVFWMRTKMPIEQARAIVCSLLRLRDADIVMFENDLSMQSV